MNSINLKRIASLAFYWLVIFAATAVAQSQDTTTENEPITIGTAVTINSEILDEKRRILVHLPDGYENFRSTHYPVLYLLDGETFFHHVTGIVDFLSGIYRSPRMIVVGVTNTDRNRDMTPTELSTQPLISFTGDSLSGIPMSNTGGADNFLRFLNDELVPKIEGEYRTAPFRLLAGHSFGGLFTVHTLLSRPESFKAYLAISPSLSWDDRTLIQKAQSKLGALPLDGRFLYLSVGDREMGNQIENLRTFAAIIERKDPEGLRWWYRVMADESHPSVVHPTVYDGLEMIFSRYRITEQRLSSGNLPAIEEQFTEASEFYGYDIPVPEQLMNLMGYLQLQLTQQPEKAVQIFRRSAELYPNSANVYDRLGDGYSAAGNLKEAKTSYQKAVKLAEQQEHPNLENYRANLQRVTEQLEGEKVTAN